MQIHDVKIDDLNPAPYNPRQMDDEFLGRLAKSVAEFGWLEPVVANRTTGNVIGGHQRLKAAKLAGQETIPTIWVEMEPDREKAANLALNKITGEWDLPKLKDVLEELDTGAFDMELTGFGEREIEELMLAESPSIENLEVEKTKAFFVFSINELDSERVITLLQDLKIAIEWHYVSIAEKSENGQQQSRD